MKLSKWDYVHNKYRQLNGLVVIGKQTDYIYFVC